MGIWDIGVNSRIINVLSVYPHDFNIYVHHIQTHYIYNYIFLLYFTYIYIYLKVYISTFDGNEKCRQVNSDRHECKYAWPCGYPG